jgi:hypothetical protein
LLDISNPSSCVKLFSFEVMLSCTLLTGAARAQALAEWIEASGHRVIRLTPDSGGSSFYFHQNGYTAAGDKLVISTRQGLAAIDLKTRKTAPPAHSRRGCHARCPLGGMPPSGENATLVTLTAVAMTGSHRGPTLDGRDQPWGISIGGATSAALKRTPSSVISGQSTVFSRVG